MSFDEKNTWVFALVSLCGTLTYFAILFARSRGAPWGEVAYVGPMLATIGGAVAAGVVGNVVVSASAPSEAGQRDDRDREIERFGTHVGQSMLVIAGLAALALTMAKQSHFWIAQTLYLGFSLSALLGSAARLAAYRRGSAPW